MRGVLVFLIGMFPCHFAGAWSSDVQASGSFTATIAYENQNIYQHFDNIKKIYGNNYKVLYTLDKKIKPLEEIKKVKL